MTNPKPHYINLLWKGSDMFMQYRKTHQSDWVEFKLSKKAQSQIESEPDKSLNNKKR